MKNKKQNSKKGFTLVELLAVIVILAIILVIAVPKVMSIIKDSKKATLETTVKMIASAAEKAKIQNEVLGKTDRITCESVAKMNDVDYESCTIDFDGNTAKVNIAGKNKFAGIYVCGGTKNNSSASDEECALPNGMVKNEKGLKAALLTNEEITLVDNIELTETLIIEADKNITLNLNGYTISGNWNKNSGAIIKNEGNVTINNGTISSNGENGGTCILNTGTASIENVTINGAPRAEPSWPSYAINNGGNGNMIINYSTVMSVHGGLSSYDNGIATINNSNFELSGIPGFPSYTVYTYNDGKAIINNSNITNNATDQVSSGGSAINGDVTVNSGFIKGRIENYYGTPCLQGGTYTVEPKNSFIAEGYKITTTDDGMYVVEKDESSQ